MQESGENYLETIYLLHEQMEKVRPVDVARQLGYSKPSVTRAMGLLKEQGFIEIQPGKGIILTKEGNKRAKAQHEKFEACVQFLMMTTDVDLETAKADAAKMKFFISDKTYEGIQNFIKQVEEYNN